MKWVFPENCLTFDNHSINFMNCSYCLFLCDHFFRLQEMKQDFARKAEEVARLTQENIDAELRMTEINDSHE